MREFDNDIVRYRFVITTRPDYKPIVKKRALPKKAMEQNKAIKNLYRKGYKGKALVEAYEKQKKTAKRKLPTII